MGMDILIVDTPMDRLVELSKLFKYHYYWCGYDNNSLLIMQTLIVASNNTTTYSNLSEDDLATLEFLPDFDTRYTYLLSLSLGINA